MSHFPYLDLDKRLATDLPRLSISARFINSFIVVHTSPDHKPNLDMGSPKSHLPQSLTQDHVQSLLDTLSSPSPQEIRKLKVTAEFHIIFVIIYTAVDLKSWLSTKDVRSQTDNATQEYEYTSAASCGV
jgi:hypothetical protein